MTKSSFDHSLRCYYGHITEIGHLPVDQISLSDQTQNKQIMDRFNQLATQMETFMTDAMPEAKNLAQQHESRCSQQRGEVHYPQNSAINTWEPPVDNPCNLETWSSL